MTEVVLVTQQFPCAGGEQFLETEVRYYPEQMRVTVLPEVCRAPERPVPECVTVDGALSEAMKHRNRPRLLLRALRHGETYRGFFGECLRPPFSRQKLKVFVSSLLRFQAFYDFFDAWFAALPPREGRIVYTYWHHEAAYALSKLKRRYGFRLVSRIHGADLYRERRPGGCLPLKKQFVRGADRLFVITPKAIDYLCDTYGFGWERLALSRLGVQPRGIVCPPSGAGELHLVSCAYLTDVKRIDRIVSALRRAAERRPRFRFRWTHIGDGPLRKRLEAEAACLSEEHPAVSCRFAGHLENEAVYGFYRENAVDLFVNVSDSEGVPVSIMEAMSCRIPVLAPDIGGISDMVADGESGLLLPAFPSADAIADALTETAFWKRDSVRRKSYDIFSEKYDARRNYPAFVAALKELP